MENLPNNDTRDIHVHCSAEPKNIKEGSPKQSDMPYRVMYWVDGSAENEWLHIGGCHEFPVKGGEVFSHRLRALFQRSGLVCRGRCEDASSIGTSIFNKRTVRSTSRRW